MELARAIGSLFRRARLRTRCPRPHSAPILGLCRVSDRDLPVGVLKTVRTPLPFRCDEPRGSECPRRGIQLKKPPPLERDLGSLRHAWAGGGASGPSGGARSSESGGPERLLTAARVATMLPVPVPNGLKRSGSGSFLDGSEQAVLGLCAGKRDHGSTLCGPDRFDRAAARRAQRHQSQPAEIHESASGAVAIGASGAVWNAA
jgi:hypothetical protein